MTTPTRVSTPFDAASSAAEVVAGIDLTGRRAIITGATSGIGVETARALAQTGAHVTFAVRNVDAGRRTADDITATTGNPQIDVAPLDLAALTSVQTFVSEWTGPLHILVNNAGVMATPELRTPDGFELQFATNHLGHFALATGLHGALVAAEGARIVSVSSAGHQRSPVVFDDIHFRERAYDPFLAYGQSKTANVLFAVEASHRWADEGIFVNALMPGAVMTPGATAAADSLSDEQLAQMRALPGSQDISWRTPRQGAATSVLLATSPLLDGISGRYFEDCQEAGPNLPGTRTGVAAHAMDPGAATRLWNASIEMLASTPWRSASGSRR